MNSILQALKRLCRIGIVTNAGMNGAEFWTQQISYLGKTSSCWFMSPYGMHSHLPPDTEKVQALFFSAQGHEEAKIGMGWTPKIRPDLEPGEVAFYHPLTGSTLIFKNSGDIDIVSAKDGNPTNINIDCDAVTINATGTVTVNAPDMILNGNLQVNGTIDATGIIHSDADVTGPNISLESHTHLGSPTAPDGPIANTGAPQ